MVRMNYPRLYTCFISLLFTSYIASLALGSIQLMFSFIVNSEFAYIMVVAVVVLSAYIRKAVCIGNAFMYINTTYIKGGTIPPTKLIFISCVVIMVCINVLIIKFRRIDIL